VSSSLSAPIKSTDAPTEQPLKATVGTKVEGGAKNRSTVDHTDWELRVLKSLQKIIGTGLIEPEDPRMNNFTLSQAIEGYALYFHARHLSQNTFNDYFNTYNKFIDFLGEDSPIVKITSKDIEPLFWVPVGGAARRCVGCKPLLGCPT